MDPVVDGAEFGGVNSTGTPALFRRFGVSGTVTFGGCEGRYILSLVPVHAWLIEHASLPVESDYMLYWSFEASNGAGCPTSLESRCADSWFVRVTDSDGIQVSSDNPGSD
jgi:hypothetical protein